MNTKNKPMIAVTSKQREKLNGMLFNLLIEGALLLPAKNNVDADAHRAYELLDKYDRILEALSVLGIKMKGHYTTDAKTNFSQYQA